MAKQARTVWERIREVLEERKLPATQKYFAEKLLKIRQPSIAEWNRVGVYPKMGTYIPNSLDKGKGVKYLYTHAGFPGKE